MTTPNQTAARNFRLEVMVHLLQSRLPAAHPGDEASPFRSLLTDTDQFSHIAGLSPWVLHVSAGANGDALSEALLNVGAAAQAAGTDYHAAILRRKGYPVEDSYALMPLSVFTRILHALRSGTPRTASTSHPAKGMGEQG
jgi:hypothetical protein